MTAPTNFPSEKVICNKNIMRTQRITKIVYEKRIKHGTSCSQNSINRMLLIISSVFIALNLPSYLVRLCVYFEGIAEIRFFRIYFECLQQFAMILYYTNFSINFLLYTMCGKAFRMCLKTFVSDIFKKLFCFPNRTPGFQL
ncbi:uncharacterized protein LOC130441383 [Diorhabda sublineata]|uniref:uncharacterized protein LOC130441383 n=1 Tax=Diorhabda sublineata TaxID=1163346 RepID=UPI0024E17446|nr:uncharacterized protein LOC130441383 [Diorhabda sublineata]